MKHPKNQAAQQINTDELRFIDKNLMKNV